MEIVKPTPICPEDEAYIQYIDAHRKNLLTAFYRFAPQICLCLSLLGPSYKELRKRIGDHDASKYTVEEFEPYRQFFFPVEGQEKNKDRFLRGWRHHYTNNKHHWEYWLQNGSPAEMDKFSIAEMILDWIAMSIQFKNNPNVWYRQNKKRIVLHKRTQESVEKIMETLAKSKEYPFSIRPYRRTRQKK